MSKVSVIGLGPMGASLARALMAAGYEVTAWNRSSEKAAGLVAEGAAAAASVAEAVAASPVIMICVKDYATTRALFDSVDATAVLPGRSVIQLGTGTPREAIDSENWFRHYRAGYLDGAILAAPVDIGNAGSQILIAGEGSVWQACEPILSGLAEKLDYTGEKIDAAAILDLAWLGQRLCTYLGVFQAVLMCEAGGVDLDVYADTIAPDERMKLIAGTIKNDRFDEVVNSVGVWRDALRHVLIQGRESGVNTEVLDFIDDKFERARVAGYVDQDIAAVIKIFRAGGR